MDLEEVKPLIPKKKPRKPTKHWKDQKHWLMNIFLANHIDSFFDTQPKKPRKQKNPKESQRYSSQTIQQPQKQKQPRIKKGMCLTMSIFLHKCGVVKNSEQCKTHFNRMVRQKGLSIEVYLQLEAPSFQQFLIFSKKIYADLMSLPETPKQKIQEMEKKLKLFIDENKSMNKILAQQDTKHASLSQLLCFQDKQQINQDSQPQIDNANIYENENMNKIQAQKNNRHDGVSLYLNLQQSQDSQSQIEDIAIYESYDQ